jgi:ATP-dependent exoDNAse (exonuclease V) alpha subunit
MAVDLALLEMAANGSTLNAGQASLVRQMCTSGARLQLAIAPAGAGKTTAISALALAWTHDGGQAIGFAPSAAAAAVLGEQTGIRTDTLAKLTWSLDHGELPDWATAVGPSTLLIIDEVGMADTLSLDTAVQFAIGRGASVRLVGDDQQLAAIGAGGVLRDIEHTYGALHLTELHRFTDPAEAAASLSLREGKPEALDSYLDRGRVHVGDIATTTHDAFAAWVSDRAARLDAIMLAPTRKLVAELNRQARDHLLGGHPPAREVRLADGNEASVGDVIITRSNDRRLRLAPADWVKNGDRWTITRVGRRGDLTVRHNRSHRTVRLPADYVQASTGLGYATTIHAAQGVTADTMHGLITGQESRQQPYTMLTAAERRITCTCRWSATATRTP